MQRTALVVDDSKSARFALRRHLESHAYAVETADCAQEAYRLVQVQRPDLIFLDHIMPGIDGFAAMRQLKQDPITATIPIVICSSNEGHAFIAEARDQGATDVLPKPPTPEHLHRLLASLALQEREQEIAASLSAAELSDALDDRDGLLDAEPAASTTDVLATTLAEPEREHPPEPEPDSNGATAPSALEAEVQALRAHVVALEHRLDTELVAMRAQFTRELEDAGRKALAVFAQRLLKSCERD